MYSTRGPEYGFNFESCNFIFFFCMYIPPDVILTSNLQFFFSFFFLLELIRTYAHGEGGEGTNACIIGLYIYVDFLWGGGVWEVWT